jgi:hypothetical protein
MYLYGTNEYVFIYGDDGTPMLLSDVMDVFKDQRPQFKVDLQSGRKVDFVCARKLVIPVNKENCLKYGIVDPMFADEIPESITLEISPGKNYLTKPELFVLDLLSNYQWDRPLHMLNMGGDLDVGLRSFLTYEGFSYKFTPIRNSVKSTDVGKVNALHLYDLMKNVYTWDALKRTDWFVDYQNCYTFLGVLSQRAVFANVADALIKAGENEKALEILDLCQENVPEANFPLETISIGFTTNDYMVVSMIEDYYKLGADDKGREMALRFANELLRTSAFYLDFYDYATDDFETCTQYLGHLLQTLDECGDKETADQVEEAFKALLDSVKEG